MLIEINFDFINFLLFLKSIPEEDRDVGGRFECIIDRIIERFNIFSETFGRFIHFKYDNKESVDRCVNFSEGIWIKSVNPGVGFSSMIDILFSALK